MNRKQRAAQIAEFLEDLLEQQDRIESKLDSVFSLLKGRSVDAPDQDEDDTPSSRRSSPPSAKNSNLRRERGISDQAYYRIGCKVVRELLKPEAPVVGKMGHVLQKELKEGDTTFQVAMYKLSQRESFLVLSSAARGQPRFVRIKDRAAAEAWLSEATDKYKKLMALDGFEQAEEEEA